MFIAYILGCFLKASLYIFQSCIHLFCPVLEIDIFCIVLQSSLQNRSMTMYTIWSNKEDTNRLTMVHIQR